jgi:hypothetical protein
VLRNRLRLAGENAELACRWRRWARPLCRAQPEKLTDINHFGYALRRCFTKAMGRTEVRASGRVAGLASVRLTMSTYHVDLPKSTTATPRRYWGRARNGLGLESVKPESSMSVPVADVPSRLDAAPADSSAQPGFSIP